MGGSGSVDLLPVVEGAPQDDLRPVPTLDFSRLTDYGKKSVDTVTITLAIQDFLTKASPIYRGGL